MNRSNILSPWASMETTVIGTDPHEKKINLLRE
jgi:hypothetical protein